MCLINLLEKIKCGLCCDQVRGYGPKSMRCRATNQSRRNGVLRWKLECSRDGYGYWWPPHVFSVSIAIVRRPLLMRSNLGNPCSGNVLTKAQLLNSICRFEHCKLSNSYCWESIEQGAINGLDYMLCMLIYDWIQIFPELLIKHYQLP